MGVAPKFWTKFLKYSYIQPSELAYKGCQLVERPRTFGSKREKKKEISVVKYNTSVHTTCGRRYN